ncbi:hypothetical protein [Stutzerimonas balearica]|uniref:hypothetical protein n=1 Tax=Stutzerimonas balearica TaxID=74829 RepID=UPI003786FADB
MSTGNILAMDSHVSSAADLDLLWSQLVSNQIGFSSGPDSEPRVTYEHRLKQENFLRLSTSEITALALDLLTLANVDAGALAVKLKGNETATIYYAAIAIRTLFETEKIYVEVPNASLFFNVPKSFVLLVLAALTGIAAQKTSELGGVAPGICAGISGLLINIIASRYTSTEVPKTDWIEEALLALLQTEGRQSASEIEKRTNFHSPLVQTTLKELIYKKLVIEKVDWTRGRQAYYELRG